MRVQPKKTLFSKIDGDVTRLPEIKGCMLLDLEEKWENNSIAQQSDVCLFCGDVHSVKEGGGGVDNRNIFEIRTL
jgi:hypothetical protein